MNKLTKEVKNQKGSPRACVDASREAGVVHILTVLLLIAGIAIGVYLVQKQQLFKSKASSAPIIDALEIRNSEGNVINCDSNTNPPTCEISDPNITIRLKDTNALIPSAQ